MNATTIFQEESPAPTEIHVISVGPRGVGSVAINHRQDLLLDLSDRVHVENFHSLLPIRLVVVAFLENTHGVNDVEALQVQNEVGL